MNQQEPTDATADPDLLAAQQDLTSTYANQRQVVRNSMKTAVENHNPSFMERVADVPLGVAGGMLGFEHSILKGANDVYHSVSGSHFMDPEDLADISAAAGQNQTFLGGMTKSITQFAIAQSMLRGVGVPAGSGFLGKSASLGLTDFTAFSGDDGRLADLIGQSPTLRKYAVGWLMTDPDDSWAYKRFKNSVEGWGLNWLTHGAAKTLGKAFGVAMDSVQGKTSPDAESLIRAADPSALKEITESPEAARVTSEVKAAMPTVPDEQIKSVLLAYRQMGSRYGESLDSALKRVTVKGTTLEELAAQAAEPEFQGYKPSPEILKMGEEADAATKSAQEAGQLQTPGSEMENTPPPSDQMASDPSPDPTGQLQAPDSATLEEGKEPASDVSASPAQAVLNAKPPPDARGAVSFYGDHQAVIYLFKNADFSTLVHESFHVWEKWWIAGEDAEALSKAFGGDREASAAAFERYLLDGVAPKDSKMAGLMGKFSGWMKSIYQNITGTPLQDEVKPEIRKVFDNIMSGEPHASRLPAASSPEVQFQSGMVKPPRLETSLPPEHMAEVNDAIDSILKTGAPPEEIMARAVEARIAPHPGQAGLVGSAADYLEADVGLMADKVFKDSGGVESLKFVADKANKFVSSIADDPQAVGLLMKSMEGDAKAVANAKFRLAYAGEMFTGHYNKASELAAKLLNAADADKPNIAQEISWRLKQGWELQRIYLNTRRELGRALGTLRNIPEGDTDVAKAMDFFNSRVTNNLNSPEAKQILRELAVAGSDDLNAGVFSTRLFKNLTNPTLNAVIEYRTNSLLSGLSTSLAKTISDAIQVIVRPGERWIGGKIQQGIGAVFPNNVTAQSWSAGGERAAKVAVQEAVQTMHLSQSLFDVTKRIDGVYSPFESGMNAFKNETHGFEGTPTGKAISSTAFNVDPNSGMGKALDFIGPIIRIPGRIMGGITDTFAQLKYQSMVAGKAAVEAGEQGLTNPSEIKAFINGRMREAFDEHGAPTDAEAFAEAGRSTASAPLTGFSKKIGDAIDAHPWTKMIMPFYRVPLNLMDTGMQYTPGLQFLSSSFRDQLLRGTPAVKAAATGRLAVGAAFWTAAVSLAASGVITGEGPTDSKLRETLLTSGWRPHSIVFDNDDGTKTYLDYHKIEPYANVLSIAGDFAEMGHMMSDKDLSDSATFMVGSVAKNLVNKTYLTGLADFIDMLRKPDHTMARFLGNMAGSFAPRLLGNFDPDGELRQVRGFMDGVKARVPGYSSDLPPVRNALGEPLMKSDPQWSPIRFASGPNDPVSQEFAQYNKGLPSAPRRLLGMDLTQFSNEKGQDAHDRLAELVGETKMNGRTLRESLGKLFQSQFYQSSPRVDDPNDITNPRVNAVQQLFYSYHEAAKAQLLREYPDIGKFYAAQQKAHAIAGNANVQKLLSY